MDGQEWREAIDLALAWVLNREPSRNDVNVCLGAIATLRERERQEARQEALREAEVAVLPWTDEAYEEDVRLALLRVASRAAGGVS